MENKKNNITLDPNMEAAEPSSAIVFQPAAPDVEAFNATTNKKEQGLMHEGDDKKKESTPTLIGDASLLEAPIDTPINICSKDGDNADGLLVLCPKPSRFKGYVITRQGGRLENQDSFIIGKTRLGYLLVVCDGMGGGPGGKTASQMACNIIFNTVNTSPLKLPANIKKSENSILNFALEFANYNIKQYAQEHPSLKGMGTTCALVLITRNKAFVKHVDDSRVYQLRGMRKVYRTTDHSYVFELLKQHALKTEEQARLSTQANIITSALGISREIPHIESQELAYKKGDRFLITTDGIHGTMPEKRLLEDVCLPVKDGKEEEGLRHIMRQLADKVDSIGIGKGNKYDNLTGVLIEMATDSALNAPLIQNVKDKIIKMKNLFQ